MNAFGMVAWISLALAFFCAAVIAYDEFRHPQKMWIMNIVWPVTALYFSVFALWAYFRFGTGNQKMSAESITGHQRDLMRQSRKEPTSADIGISDSHCGAGCTIGDIIAGFVLFALGWTLFGKPLFAQYAADLLLAWLLGIIFQYFTIMPLRHLSTLQALLAAIKSDTLSILAFEIGLFAWMALTSFVFFPSPHLRVTGPDYCFMMQIGMIFGFVTSYPMNRWLIKAGWKQAMV
jgi:hypothetical protein